MDRIKKVSFVIPCYRSEHTLPHVVKEIRETMQKLTQYTYDIFLVNDASPDNTMGTIRELCEKYDNIKGIGFARNFGQHAALMAGLRHSDGDYVVCLDDDGQTPADEVDKLLDKLEEGYDAVYASYEHKQHSAFRLYAEEAAWTVVQRIYGIFCETVADRHISRCGLRRTWFPLWDLYDH